MKRSIVGKRERAQSLVEFSLTFTLVMFILSGTVDIGRAYFALIALKDAANEGALYSSMQPSSLQANLDDIEAHVRATSTNPINLQDTDNVSVQVLWPDSRECAGFFYNAGDPAAYGITVKVTYIFPITMPLMDRLISSTTLPLSAQSTHSILTPECP